MNNPIFQQSEQFFKPMADMMALNARTFEALAEKQTDLMSDVWNDGVNCARGISDKRDVESLYATQKDFWDTVNQKVSSTAKDSYALLTEAQEKMSELIQDSMSAVDVNALSETFEKSVNAAQDTAKSAARSASHASSQAAAGAAKAGQKAQQHTQSAKNTGKSGEARPR